MNRAQNIVADWVIKCFGYETLVDRHERALRLLEEAIEVAQVEGVDLKIIKKLSEKVYSKPVGDPIQEAGGVGLCLLAYAEALDEKLDDIIWEEIVRILEKPIDHFKERQNKKADSGIAKRVL